MTTPNQSQVACDLPQIWLVYQYGSPNNDCAVIDHEFVVMFKQHYLGMEIVFFIMHV